MDIGYENGTRTQTSNLLKQYKWPINMEVHSTLVRNLHKLWQYVILLYHILKILETDIPNIDKSLGE